MFWILQDDIDQGNGDLSSKSMSPGQSPYLRDNLLNNVNILLDLFRGPDAKFLSLVGMSKFTTITRAISSYPQEKAIGLTRRTDRTLFKTKICHQITFERFSLTLRPPQTPFLGWSKRRFPRQTRELDAFNPENSALASRVD